MMKLLYIVVAALGLGLLALTSGAQAQETSKEQYLYTKLYATAPQYMQADTEQLSGAGMVRYTHEDETITVQAEHIPVLQGTTQGYAFRVIAVPRTSIAVEWKPGEDIELSNFTLRVHWTHLESEQSHSIDLPPAELTTGSVYFDEQNIEGIIDLSNRAVLLVGTVTLPETGIDAIDEYLAGQKVLLQYHVSVLPLQD